MHVCTIGYDIYHGTSGKIMIGCVMNTISRTDDSIVAIDTIEFL